MQTNSSNAAELGSEELRQLGAELQAYIECESAQVIKSFRRCIVDVDTTGTIQEEEKAKTLLVLISLQHQLDRWSARKVTNGTALPSAVIEELHRTHAATLVGVLDFTTLENAAVCWTGYNLENQRTASAFAAAESKKTIEMTRGGMVLDNLDLFATEDTKRVGNALFDAASKIFAESASGEVTAVVYSPITREQEANFSRSTFCRIEEPILKRREFQGQIKFVKVPIPVHITVHALRQMKECLKRLEIVRHIASGKLPQDEILSKAMKEIEMLRTEVAASNKTENNPQIRTGTILASAQSYEEARNEARELFQAWSRQRKAEKHRQQLGFAKYDEIPLRPSKPSELLSAETSEAEIDIDFTYSADDLARLTIRERYHELVQESRTHATDWRPRVGSSESYRCEKQCMANFRAHIEQSLKAWKDCLLKQHPNVPDIEELYIKYREEDDAAIVSRHKFRKCQAAKAREGRIAAEWEANQERWKISRATDKLKDKLQVYVTEYKTRLQNPDYEDTKWIQQMDQLCLTIGYLEKEYQRAKDIRDKLLDVQCWYCEDPKFKSESLAATKEADRAVNDLWNELKGCRRPDGVFDVERLRRSKLPPAEVAICQDNLLQEKDNLKCLHDGSNQATQDKYRRKLEQEALDAARNNTEYIIHSAWQSWVAEGVINSLAAAGGGESVAESAIDIVEQNVLKIFADEVQRLEDIKVKWCEESISRASRSSIAASEYYAGNPAMWNDLSSRERSFHNESIRRTAEVALVAEAEKLEEEMHLRGKEIERLAASFIASTAQKASAKKAAEDTAAELLRNLRKQIAQAREKVAKARAFVNSTHNRWTDMFQTQTKKQAIDSLLQAETDLMNLQTRYRPLNREAAMTEYPILRRNYDEEACFEFEQNEKKRRLQWAQRTPVEKELYLAHWQSKDYKVVSDENKEIQRSATAMIDAYRSAVANEVELNFEAAECSYMSAWAYENTISLWRSIAEWTYCSNTSRPSEVHAWHYTAVGEGRKAASENYVAARTAEALGNHDAANIFRKSACFFEMQDTFGESAKKIAEILRSIAWTSTAIHKSHSVVQDSGSIHILVNAWRQLKIFHHSELCEYKMSSYEMAAICKKAGALQEKAILHYHFAQDRKKQGQSSASAAYYRCAEAYESAAAALYDGRNAESEQQACIGAAERNTADLGYDRIAAAEDRKDGYYVEKNRRCVVLHELAAQAWRLNDARSAEIYYKLAQLVYQQYAERLALEATEKGSILAKQMFVLAAFAEKLNYQAILNMNERAAYLYNRATHMYYRIGLKFMSEEYISLKDRLRIDRHAFMKFVDFTLMKNDEKDLRNELRMFELKHKLRQDKERADMMCEEAATLMLQRASCFGTD
jgi:hypothetical protein